MWHSLAASSVSAIVSRAATYPADTIKARLQLQGALQGPLAYRSTLHAVRQALAAEGAAGLYRGFAAVLAGVLPANALYYATYELLKGHLPGPLGGAAVGAAAQMVAGVAFTPTDIIKERLQVAPLMGGTYRYRSAWHALKALLREHGMRGLFKGYWLTNSVWIPWSMLYVAAYEESKRRLTAHLHGADPAAVDGSGCGEREAGACALPAWGYAASSAGSAATAALATQPLDVVKTRLQVLSAGKGGGALTAWSVARSLFRREGLRGFAGGNAARVAQLAAGAAVSWVTYEEAKLRLAGL
ncbi:hypothetical protein WJX81_001743 [Elliptochloris bilobata]|uniref:Mitochondrial carrier protein n=1 Tax=Elliptochloris bilobata TaxID=381761 RepID=A0AAW1RKZ8_9CHLO